MLFEVWCWRILLRVPWTARRSNQSILKEVSPWCSLIGLMLKLKLQYFGHLIAKSRCVGIRPWCWERLRPGGKGDDRGWDGWIASPTHGFGWTPGVGDGQGGLACCGSWGCRVGHSWATELNWCKKGLNDLDNHNSMVTHLEPDILECEVKWALESITTNKLVEVMEFQLSYFKSSKMLLLKCCNQYVSKFGKLSRGHRTGKSQLSFQSQRKAVPKNVQTTVQLPSFHIM